MKNPLLDLLLNRDKVYILPTRYGCAFCFLNLSVIMVASTYSNNLVYLLAFILFAIIKSSLVQTHINFKGVKLEHIDVQSGHAGQHVSFQLTLNSEQDTYQIEALPLFKKFKTRASHTLPFLKSQQSGYMSVKTPMKKRGLYELRAIRLSSIYPLGLWYAWKYVKIERPVYVYPKLEGQQTLPTPQTFTDKVEGQATRGGDDYSEHRPYVQGESYRHIDWRAQARTQQLLVKRFDEGGHKTYQIHWQDVREQDAEKRLSQLSVWVHKTFQNQEYYSLSLPGKEISIDQGHYHYHQCMQALAVYDAA